MYRTHLNYINVIVSATEAGEKEFILFYFLFFLIKGHLYQLICLLCCVSYKTEKSKICLPAAHNGNGNKGNNEDHSSSCWPRNQRKLFSQLRLEIFWVTQRKDKQVVRMTEGWQFFFWNVHIVGEYFGHDEISLKAKWNKERCWTGCSWK